MNEQRAGVVLINLGTPRSPDVADVRSYLQEFLMDPLVLDMPWWRRFLLVHVLILPRRPQRSSESYRKIWTDRGSPLLIHGQELRDKVRDRLASTNSTTTPVELAMRYGEPSIPKAVERLRKAGCRRIVALPLYAQSSDASTTSSVDALRSAATPDIDVTIIPPFFAADGYLDYKTKTARSAIDEVDPDLVLFSYHGLPVRQLQRTSPQLHCMSAEGCCDNPLATSSCYRAQCLRNSNLLAMRLGLEDDQFRVSFQSRLGRTPWITPATEDVLRKEARNGRRRVVVIAGFLADCLETLEEVAIAGRELWRQNGGEELVLVEAPNGHDDWADTVVGWVRESLAA